MFFPNSHVPSRFPVVTPSSLHISGEHHSHQFSPTNYLSANHDFNHAHGSHTVGASRGWEWKNNTSIFDDAMDEFINQWLYPRINWQKQQVGCHLNFCQGDRREAPLSLFCMTGVGVFSFVGFFPRQCLAILEGIQTSSLRWSSNISRTNGTLAGDTFLEWGWSEKHRIEIKNEVSSGFVVQKKSCACIIKMHIHSNMFKHHQWIPISSTYPQYLGHLLYYHLSCDFIWQWLNNQRWASKSQCPSSNTFISCQFVSV